MTEQEIRDGAPSGAQYYCLSNQGVILYFKHGFFDWIVLYNNGWWDCCNQDIKPYLKPL